MDSVGASATRRDIYDVGLIRTPVTSIWGALRPPRRRGWVEFAESEIVLPTGPRAGLRFRCDYMPWSRLLLEEYERGRFSRFFLSGPVQSGKTLLGLGIPLMYHLFELRETVIMGVPKIDLAQGIYDERVRPIIERSRYRDMIPRKGSGSKGGKFLAIRFRNGAWLRFMGAGAGDEQRSSHTARVIVLTEIDKMDQPGKASRETDPVRQMEARARSFNRSARIYAECTMSTTEGRVYQEVCEWGTDSAIYYPCPQCGEYFRPEREHLIGWHGASDEIESGESTRLECPSCKGQIEEEARQSMLKRPVIAARGQTIGEDGKVLGALPRSRTFGFRWNAVSSAMVALSDIGEAEFRAERSESPQDAKEVAQFYWALPYREEIGDLLAMDRSVVMRKIGQRLRGVIPKDAPALTAFVDLGLYYCWYTIWAWREDAQGYLVDHGAIEVPQERQPSEAHVLHALRAWKADVCDVGWTVEGAKSKRPDLVWVDSGWSQKVAYSFVLEGGPGWAATKGYGSAKNQRGWINFKPSANKAVGDHWALTLESEGVYLFHLDADFWKAEVHKGLIAPFGVPGSLSIFQADERDHIHLARQLTAERQEEEWVPGTGWQKYWKRVYKHNHYLDCSAGCRAAASYLGISDMRPNLAPKPARSSPGVVVTKRSSRSSVRTRY